MITDPNDDCNKHFLMEWKLKKKNQSINWFYKFKFITMTWIDIITKTVVINDQFKYKILTFKT